MRILFAGGGTGGHFYPLIAVAQEIRSIIEEEKLVDAELFYMADKPINPRLLFEQRIEFIPVTAGKIRRYFSIRNFFDMFKVAAGIISATKKMYFLFPDVIFSKGGYPSVPVLWAARLLRIPVIIHESDSHPGRANLWAGKFALKIAVSYPEAAKYFPADKTAITGNPIRQELLHPITAGAHEYLGLKKDLPILFIVGGSLGSQKINDTIIDILPKLLEKYQIIHQVGQVNYEDAKKRATYILEKDENRDRYKLFDYLNETAMRMTAGVASLVISRAGSAVFEFAQWEIPAILIPIPESISHDQRTNAFTYARSGGAIVIEEKNLTPSILLSEIDRILNNKMLYGAMKEGAKKFARPDAARLIARELINICLEHE